MPFGATGGLAAALLGVALAGLGLVMPRVADAVTLREELLVLLGGHPSIKASQDSVRAAAEAVGRADASFLPVVTLTGDQGYKEINGPGQRAAKNIWRRGFEQYGLSVTQNLYDGNRKYHEKSGAELTREAAKNKLMETRHNLLLQGANTYVDVLRQISLVRLSRRSEATIALQLSLEDERVKKGGGTSVDVLLSKTRLQRSKEQRIIFEGRLRDAVTSYINVFGKEPILEELEDDGLRMDLVPDSVDTAIARALAVNPIILGSNKQIDIAHLRQRSAASDYYPRLDVVGATNWEDNREGTAGMRRDWSATLQATWSLFTGFSPRSTVTEAAHTYSASINNHLFVNRQIEEETRLAWQGVLTACDRRLLLDNATIIAGEVHASRVKLREGGKETVINVLDAESEVFNAEISLAQASYDENLATFRLVIAMGMSLADALVKAEDTPARAEAETRYIARCEERLLTISLRTPPASEARGGANPFAAPADDDSAGATDNPLAAPAEDDDDASPANPFKQPSANPSLDDDQSALPIRPKPDLIAIDEDLGSVEVVIEAEIKPGAEKAMVTLTIVLNNVEEELEPSGAGPDVRLKSLIEDAIEWDDDVSVRRASSD
jgi:adhesin transport system outer membrane protein